MSTAAVRAAVLAAVLMSQQLVRLTGAASTYVLTFPANGSMEWPCKGARGGHHICCDHGWVAFVVDPRARIEVKVQLGNASMWHSIAGDRPLLSTLRPVSSGPWVAKRGMEVQQDWQSFQSN